MAASSAHNHRVTPQTGTGRCSFRRWAGPRRTRYIAEDCTEVAAYCCTYTCAGSSLTGRAQERSSVLCRRHAEAWAARYGAEMPAEAR